ncbi:hypothetical protein SAMN04487948_103107 [Halogranum amylolyticum]|uniref:Uncharacterized protein n=2 Tax=Halogranum amylolyticum TaxID=660520 RepID=A0A1H8QH30_9EURY|nr:hypothetical protein SAMN04487948_103107 [Halogranum amylolyticum]
MTMPDTKSGREKKGLNKEAQLEAELTRRELRAEGQEEPPQAAEEEVDSEFLANPAEMEELTD